MTRLDAEKRIKIRKRILIRLTQAHAILEEHPQCLEQYMPVIDGLIDKLEDAWTQEDDEALCVTLRKADEVHSKVQKSRTD